MVDAKINLGRYLFERIRQLDVQSIFGVPGDFNLRLLDEINNVKDLSWVGNCNELNAAYAADGYSRVKGIEGKGFACLVTTFGVGELSALNGVAGSFAEHVGLLHVVGVPSVSAQQRQLLLHHTLGDGNFSTFRNMSEGVTLTSAFLNDHSTAADEIDRVIREAFIHQRPTYLAFPTNLVEVEVPVLRLEKPLKMEMPENDPDAESEVIHEISKMIAAASDPVILVDACCTRHDSTREAKALIDITQFKYGITPMAKGSKSVDEDGERYVGIYVGTLSYPEVKRQVETSDLVISCGALLSDFNTGSFSYGFNTKNVVELHSDCTKVRSAMYYNVRMKGLLKKLVVSDELKASLANYKPRPVTRDVHRQVSLEPSAPLTQELLWNNVSKFLREGDIVVTETGTSSFGIIQTHFPKNTFGISQILWGSIGYSVGAAMGAAQAAKEIDPNRRVILFVGDGSLQLTVQEISTMIRRGTTPYVFVLNNDGYTIEKFIHGMEADYNQIQPWKYQNFLDIFGAKSNYEVLGVKNIGELQSLFSDKNFAKNDKIRLIELFLNEYDCPKNLVSQAEQSAKTNNS